MMFPERLKSASALFYTPVLSIIALAGIATFAAGGMQSASPPIELKTLSFQEQTAYWQERIRAVGGAVAYQELARAVDDLPSTQAHVAAHVFGGALWKTEGLDGISTCDRRFAYACFHEFMLRAIEENGDGFAQKLTDACVATLGDTAAQCQHGIGHGLLEQFGYDRDGISQALAVCDSLTPRLDQLEGCAGGIFMEYSIRAMLTDGAFDPRPFMFEERLEPCASLDDEHRIPCVYWQPGWWTTALSPKDDVRTLVRDMAEWCKEMPGGESIYETCIAGITNRMQVLAGENASNVADICGLVSDDIRYRYQCQYRSAKRFTYFYPLSEALKACDGLPASFYDSCRKRATTETAERRANKKEDYDVLDAHIF